MLSLVNHSFRSLWNNTLNKFKPVRAFYYKQYKRFVTVLDNFYLKYAKKKARKEPEFVQKEPT